MSEWLATALIFVGTAASVLAAVGLLRMPDLYMRIQAAAKSSTLGVSCLVLAAAIHLGTTSTTTRGLLIVAFLFLTTPVAAHMIGRSAYAAGVELWDRSLIDELRDESSEFARTKWETEPPGTPGARHDR